MEGKHQTIGVEGEALGGANATDGQITFAQCTGDNHDLSMRELGVSTRRFQRRETEGTQSIMLAYCVLSK
jgi:hypothetical protein